jgi:DNA-formamidopyrimidine glycosylase
MPEGPEVKLISNYLNKNLTGKYIQTINILSGRYKHHSVPKNFNNFIKVLPLKVKSVNSYGKFIWMEFLNSDITLWNTLGMSGWWQTNKEPHNHISLIFSKTPKGKSKIIYFNDPRNFGTIIFNSKKKLKEKIEKLGPDILSNSEESEQKFIQLVQKKKIAICEILLDQKIAAGCGNYLRAESLYLAELNPYTIGKYIPKDKLKELWNILNQLAWYFYDKSQGQKLKIINNHYRFPDEFNRIFLIYSQQIDPLGNKVKADKVKNRTIHWVPSIQL